MRRRTDRENGELLDRIAKPATLVAVSGVLLASLCFLGSSFPAPRPATLSAAPAEGMSTSISAAIGGAGSSPVVALPADTALSADAGQGGSDQGLFYSAYIVKPGDTAGDIAESFGVSVDSIISFNDIQNTRALRPGQVLKVPSMAGVLTTAKEGDTVESLAASWSVSANGIIEANGLMSPTLPAGKIVFLPDARIPSTRLKEINGDLFRWPLRGWITSRYGWRSDPFTGVRSFHDGLDIGINLGTPVGAAMEGRVIETGYSSSFGNYVLLAHHSGWMSFYGHCNSVSVKAGQWVSQGQRVAYSGNTGYSTGPHLHFTVFKNGRTMNPTVVLH